MILYLNDKCPIHAKGYKIIEKIILILILIRGPSTEVSYFGPQLKKHCDMRAKGQQLKLKSNLNKIITI